jgi:hypothetical protein
MESQTKSILIGSIVGAITYALLTKITGLSGPTHSPKPTLNVLKEV